MDYIVIKPRGGLCNYLRVIFSFYNYAKSKNLLLIVIWKKTGLCNGFFLDYFKPIKNIIFLRKNNGKKIFYQGNCGYPGFMPDYKELELLPYFQEIINRKKDLLENNYIAVHIRRTDHIKLAKKNKNFTSDNEFINFINEKKEIKNLYIATDNPNTYLDFKNKYPEKVKFNYHNIKKGLRKTSLGDAVIDLFMCINSNEFKGSGYSSFSALIEIKRNLKK